MDFLLECQLFEKRDYVSFIPKYGRLGAQQSV